MSKDDASSMSAVFTRPDAWSGGLYELAMHLGSRDDTRLARALDALWTSPDLDGCYRDPQREPHDQPRISPVTDNLEALLHGVLELPPHRVAGRSHVIRLEDDGDILSFALPLGSLSTVLPVGAFPFEDSGDLSWRVALDRLLVGLGSRVFAAVPFRRALVGWIEEDDFDLQTVPAERWSGFLERNDDALDWYPPTRGASFGCCARLLRRATT